MGNEILELYKSKVKKSWKIAFWSAFIGCLLVHIYKFTNTLPNHDALFSFYDSQDLTVSGRWFLQYACGISSYFDLPWLTGLLSAFYLGLTAVLVVDLFDMKNPFVIALSGLILAACPATTETFFFGFTADGYMLGLLLCALAANLSCRGHKWWHYVLCAVCLCISCAIYQAYMTFAVLLSICYLLDRILDKKTKVAESWMWIGRHVLIYALALAAYYGVWKLALCITGQEATNYQGISEVGQIGFSSLVSGAIRAVQSFILYFLEWNILEHPITLYAVLNILFFFSFAIIVFIAIAKSNIYRKIWTLLFVISSLIICVPMAAVWCLASPGVQYHPMMLHSAVVLYIFALILFDKWVGTKLSTIFGIGMAIMVFNFALMANISYFYMNKCYERSYYIGSQMMETIEQVTHENENISQIAFIGNLGDEISIVSEAPGNRVHLLNAGLEDHLLYDSTHAYLYLQGIFQLDLPQAPIVLINQLADNSIVQQMGCWPAKDSVATVDSTLIIKLSDITK